MTITPTYTGCPATQVIERDIRAALDGAGYAMSGRDGAGAALDDRLDQRRGQGEAARLRHRRRPDGRARGPLPAMRLGRHRGDQPVRLDAVQGACGAAAPAPSRSTCSSAISAFSKSGDRFCVSKARQQTKVAPPPMSFIRCASPESPPRRRGRSASTCPPSCARRSGSSRASTSPSGPRSAARKCAATIRSASRRRTTR